MEDFSLSVVQNNTDYSCLPTIHEELHFVILCHIRSHCLSSKAKFPEQAKHIYVLFHLCVTFSRKAVWSSISYVADANYFCIHTWHVNSYMCMWDLYNGYPLRQPSPVTPLTGMQTGPSSTDSHDLSSACVSCRKQVEATILSTHLFTHLGSKYTIGSWFILDYPWKYATILHVIIMKIEGMIGSLELV